VETYRKSEHQSRLKSVCGQVTAQFEDFRLKLDLVLGELGNAGHIHFVDGAGGAGIELDASSGLLTIGSAVTTTGALAASNLSATGGIGYGTGAGGIVTQATSRTTTVVLNKTCGAITLVSAAGSATAASFTVTNSTVAATDTIIVSQKSGTDKYIISVTAVAAGSFEITSFTTGGTTTEQPVFNFAVIKAVTS
jgi:hypothetical protein